MKNIVELKTKNIIIDYYYVQGLTIKQIKGIVNLSFTTIKNIIFNDEKNMPIASKLFSTISPYEEIIQNIFLENLKLKSNKKTSMQLFDDFIVIYPQSNIKPYRFTEYLTYLRKNKLSSESNKFIPLSHENYEGQLDFGYCFYYNNKILTRANFLLLSLPHSNACYCQLLGEKNLQNFFNAMINIFNHLNCAPKEIWFDNDSLFFYAKGRNKRPYQKFIEFAEFYNFRYVFCKPFSPNQKGHVEKNVKFIRDNIFIPIPVFKTDICDFNNELLKICDSLHYRKNKKTMMSIYETLEKDKKDFNKLPSLPFDNDIIEYFTLDKFSRIYYGKKYYYLPLNLVYPDGKSYCPLKVKAIINHISLIIYNEDGTIILDTFKRLYGYETNDISDWGNYLPLLAKEYLFLFSLPFYNTLPIIIQKYILFLNPIELQTILLNMYYVYKKYDYKISLKTASICIIKNKTTRHDFYIISNRLKKNPYYNPKC